MSHERPAPPSYWLRVDAAGVVTGLSASWNELLDEGFVACLQPASVGKPFATLGGTAATLYEELFDHVRRYGLASVDVWAATPERATKLELTLRRCDAELELGLEPLFEREREHTLPFFDPTVPRGDDGIRACGFCHRLYSFRWTDAEKALRQLHVDRYALQPRLKTDVCLDCERYVHFAAGLRAAS